MTTRMVQLSWDTYIDASPEHVWSAMIVDIALWWHRDFWLTPEPRTLTLDATAGGLLLERSETGTSLLWYRVLYVQPGRMLQLAGEVSPPTAGPATSHLSLVVKSEGSGTRFTLTDSIVGFVSDEFESSAREGWAQLFGELKTYCER